MGRDRAGEGLHVGVDRDEIGLVEAIEHDPVEHIRAGVADSDDLDGDFFFGLFRQAVIAAKLNHFKSSKFQAPSSRETPSAKNQHRISLELELEAWSFFGAWCLELGASICFTISSR